MRKTGKPSPSRTTGHGKAGPQKNGAQKDKGGYRVGGVGHYRKEFELPASFADQRVSIHFDGVYRNSTVSINGKKLGTRPYGYIPFYYNLSNNLREGTNTIEVHVDCSKEPSTRWYHPCGIYAPVRLIATHPEHFFIHDTTFVSTPEITSSKASVAIQTEINNLANLTSLELKIEIQDPDGKAVATSTTTPKKDTPVLLNLSNPQASGTLDSPSLYTAHLTLTKNGQEVDTNTVTFGIRSFKWDKNTGFHLNGKGHQTAWSLRAPHRWPRRRRLDPRTARVESPRTQGHGLQRHSHRPQSPPSLFL